MVKRAEMVGVSQAARECGTTRRTVRKWLQRYRSEGPAGLRDRSRAPRRPARKTPPEVELRVVQLRKEHPSWGARRMQKLGGIRLSHGTIERILRSHGLVKLNSRE